MTICELFHEAKRRGIRLRTSDDRIRCEAPKGTMTPSLRDALILHKPGLLAVLWRVEAMRRLFLEAPRPAAYAVKSAQGGPGRCFSCGEPLDHPDAYGRCAPCDTAAEVFYTEMGSSGDREVVA